MKKLALFYLLTFLLGCAMKINAQTTQLESRNLKDTVLQNYVRYPYSVNFIFNHLGQLAKFKGLEKYRKGEFVLKSYRLNLLFENYPDSSKIYFLVVGNKDK